MFSINVILSMAQTAIAQVSDTGPTIYNNTGSPVSTYSVGDGDDLQFSADTDSLDLETVDQTSTETGNLFTDTFKTIKNWFNDQNSAFGFTKNILGQPYGFLVDIGIPQTICTFFGIIWYSIITMLIIGFIRGSNQ